MTAPGSVWTINYEGAPPRGKNICNGCERFAAQTKLKQRHKALHRLQGRPSSR